MNADGPPEPARATTDGAAPRSLSPGQRRIGVEDVEKLHEARAVLRQTAAAADRATVERMLAVALIQLQEVAPKVSGEIWDCYLAIENAGRRPTAEPD
jgi:hypothetical protein